MMNRYNPPPDPNRLKPEGSLGQSPVDIIYRYNGDPRTDERVPNTQAVAAFLKPGVMLKRRGKEWKVVAANDDFTFTNGKASPILRVFLTDNL